jgi:hypothetical protein
VQILKKCYPHHPEAADEWLSDEIFRAACDPNALDVFKSSAYLPPPQPINFLVTRSARPTLILQVTHPTLHLLRTRCTRRATAHLTGAHTASGRPPG